MGIYNRLKTKVWQNLGQNVTDFGPLSGTTAPNFAPTAPGVVYVNTEALVIYISTGISSPSDWREVWAD
jgi:hypothetical protein